MNEAVLPQIFEGAVGGDRRRARALIGEAIDDFVGTQWFMTGEHFVEHPSPDGGEALPAFQTDGCGHRHGVIAAARVIMIRGGKSRPKRAILPCWFCLGHASIYIPKSNLLHLLQCK
jgi:hypothetical protein